MPRYDATRYDPPAAIAAVALRPSGGGASVTDVPLLIDTGADVTLLPRSAVISLGITRLTLRGSRRGKKKRATIP
jgi:hypothetical protein